MYASNWHAYPTTCNLDLSNLPRPVACAINIRLFPLARGEGVCRPPLADANFPIIALLREEDMNKYVKSMHVLHQCQITFNDSENGNSIGRDPLASKVAQQIAVSYDRTTTVLLTMVATILVAEATWLHKNGMDVAKRKQPKMLVVRIEPAMGRHT
ncbi:hypothetical protein YQE_01794, partial [Dendroctonus ponderosae]